MTNGSQTGNLMGRALACACCVVLCLTSAIAAPQDVTQDTTATGKVTGLAVHSDSRGLGETGVARVDYKLINTRQAPANVQRIEVGRWEFRLNDGGDDGRFARLEYRDDVWWGSTYWAGPGWTRVGKDWQHPGDQTPSVRRFTAPRDGQVTISGRVRKADTNNGGGDGVRLSILHRHAAIWEAEIDGDDTTGLEPGVSLTVQKGDPIRFVVHKRGAIPYDTTHWDPVITYEDGQQYRASEGFSSRTPGDDGWSYEMEVDGTVKPSLPAVQAIGRDGVLREKSLSNESPVLLSRRDAVLFVVANPRNDRCAAFAVAGDAPWEVTCRRERDARIAVELAVVNEEPGWDLQPGETIPLPGIFHGEFDEAGARGFARLARAADLEPDLERIRAEVLAPWFDLPRNVPLPELDLWALLQTEWRREDDLQENISSYRQAIERHAAQAGKLLDDLRAGHPGDFLVQEADCLARLGDVKNQPDGSLESLRGHYLRVRALKRMITLQNPLMGFDELLFCKRVPTSYSHLVMQYFGWRARPGGGIYVLERPGFSLDTRNLLGDQLPEGNVLEPRLSYDAQRVVFSFVARSAELPHYATLDNVSDEDFYHVYETMVDGSGLRQLTRGPYEDLMPTYLPDGGIAFCSTRRRGYARCFGAQFSPRWHVYTLHRMDGDGGNIRTLSFHDTNEWFPTVSNTGLILYSRWDYIDRDAVTHQNLWATHPDGTNPFTVWGNATPSPHCTFQPQPIPGTSKVVFAASAHHSVAGGSIVVVDPTRGYDGEASLTRITPDVPFPEAETRDIPEYYTAPWPLSENYFLVAYSPTPLVWEPGANLRNALGIYLLDVFGNRELLYRDPDIGSTNPCPLTPRTRPPVIASTLPDAPPPTGEMLLTDVYRGLGDVAKGTIKNLRIIQILPKTTVVANTPAIGLASEENARVVLGTVPVYPDGSAHFVVPARKPLLFQALDENGFAYQTMRSSTYVQPGERVSCVGCHENRLTTPPAASPDVPTPAAIAPGPFENEPFSFMRVVQPVLDEHCVECHSGEDAKKGVDLTSTPHNGFTKSYWSLCGDVDFNGAGTNPGNASKALVPRFGQRNQVQVTPPGGAYGARGSRLIKMLQEQHEDVELTAEELRRFAMWIDCNAVFYGSYAPKDQARQLRGEKLPMPAIQ